jgi:thiamine-phosphate pyrophosphorylase
VIGTGIGLTPRVVLITNSAFGDDAIVRCVQAVGSALSPGTFGVQLRDKNRPLVSLRIFASRLRLATRAVGAALFVNGSAVVARDVGADGVHLGGGAGCVSEARAVMGRRTWVSLATHNDDDIRRANAEGADAVFVSPVFATRASPRLPAKEPRGPDAIRSARAGARPDVAVYALGGITVETAGACAAAGADGVAVIRALLASPDPARAARAIDDALERR